MYFYWRIGFCIEKYFSIQKILSFNSIGTSIECMASLKKMVRTSKLSDKRVEEFMHSLN